MKILSCGCAPNAKTPEGKAACAIHATVGDAQEVTLAGRQAKCTYGCKESVCASDAKLAFFKHEPTKPMDSYYCGCFGWD